MHMTLTSRLQKLNEKRSALMAKRAELIEKHKSAEVVDHELKLVTARVLKFEAKAK